METTILSEKSVIICQPIRRHIPEYLNWIFINTDVTLSNLLNTDLLFLNPSTRVKGGPNFDRICSNSKFPCCGTTLMIDRPSLQRKNQITWGSDSVAQKKLEIQGDTLCISCFRKYTTYLNPETELLILSCVNRQLWDTSVIDPKNILLHRHACFTKLPWKILSQCHGLCRGTGLPYTPDTSISWFQTLYWCPDELIQKTPMGSDCVHIETRMDSECDHEQATSIANQRDLQEISTLKVLNDWT